MDHLACFVPGMLALGVSHGAVEGPKAAQYQAVAKNMTYTCYQMYKQQPTGGLPWTRRYPSERTATCI
jgi:mannosyl-oligosaccharide alpha-1,2-mannosidase